MRFHLALCHGLSIEALLQRVERRNAVAIPCADQQFAVQSTFEIHCRQNVRKGVGNVIAGASVDAPGRAFDGGLNANAVILPFGGKGVRRDEAGIDSVRIVPVRLRDQRVGQHDRPERCCNIRRWPLGASFQPVEQRDVGRCKAVPDLLDFGDVDTAEIGQCHLCHPGRNADAQPAHDQFQQRPSSGRVQTVQPASDQSGRFGACCGLQRLDDFREGRGAVRTALALPDQADRVGKIADIIV